MRTANTLGFFANTLGFKDGLDLLVGKIEAAVADHRRAKEIMGNATRGTDDECELDFRIRVRNERAGEAQAEMRLLLAADLTGNMARQRGDVYRATTPANFGEEWHRWA